MAAEIHSSAGAPLRDFDDWEAIRWPTVARHVQRLRMRIAKATREGRFNRVKALQRLMTHSFFAKLWAVRRVVTNRGKNTPGVDGVVWRTSEEKMQAARSLKRRGYHAQPLRRSYVPKPNSTKKRGLGIPTMKDRAMQALHALALVPVAETLADPNSYGFRLKRSTADAIQQCFHALGRKNCATWVLDADIEAFFDRLSHEWLLDHVPMDKVILHKWLKAGIMEDGYFRPTSEGTPQGGIISPVLANMALDGLEERIRQAVPRNSKVNVIRYADDVLTTGASREVLEEYVVPTFESFLGERDLNLSPEKTKIVDLETGVDYLGVNLRRYNGIFRQEPAKKNIRNFRFRCREAIKKRPTIKQEDLIRYLNPRIRGWANYFRHVCSSNAFRRIDFHIFQLLWRWARRRHPKKSKTWIYDRYYRSRGQRKWIFSAQVRDHRGRVRTLDLALASDVKIRRHIKVRAKAAVFDPEFEDYFRQRQFRQKKLRHRDRAKRPERPFQLSLW